MDIYEVSRSNACKSFYFGLQGPKIEEYEDWIKLELSVVSQDGLSVSQETPWFHKSELNLVV